MISRAEVLELIDEIINQYRQIAEGDNMSQEQFIGECCLEELKELKQKIQELK